MKVKRNGFLAASSLIALSLVLVGCAPGSSSSNAARPAGAAAQGGAVPANGGGQANGRRFGAIPVLAVTVKVGPLTAGNDTAATVAPVTQSSVASQVAGVVSRVVHLAGDWVKAGEPVVILDDAQMKLAVANAQAALENAKIN